MYAHIRKDALFLVMKNRASGFIRMSELFRKQLAQHRVFGYALQLPVNYVPYILFHKLIVFSDYLFHA